MDFVDLIKQFGPSAGIILFFVYRDWKRETTLDAKLTESENARVADLKSVIAANTEAMRSLKFAFDARPCMKDLRLGDK